MDNFEEEEEEKVKAVCPLCAMTGNGHKHFPRKHKQNFCITCFNKLLIRHRTHQLLKILWGAS